MTLLENLRNLIVCVGVIREKKFRKFLRIEPSNIKLPQKKIASITINNVYNTHNFSKYEQEICEQGTCEQRIYVKTYDW